MATKLLSRIIESSPRTMTAARQERKPPRLPRLLAVMALAAGIFTPMVLRAATDNHLAINGTTGLGFSGRPGPHYRENATGRTWPALSASESGSTGRGRFAGVSP